MSTDISIWGQTPDWYCPSNYMTGTNEDNKLLCGNFGTAPTGYEKGSLGNGLYHDTLPHTAFAIQKNLDDSISYCGLGNESVWSRIKYSLANKNTFGTFDREDNRNVTNFAIPYKLSTKNALYQTNQTGSGGTVQGNRCRWSPQGFDNFDFTSATQPTAANANYNRTVTPYVSIPVRNFILFPVVTVASGMNENEGSTGYSGVSTLALSKYTDLQNSVNYTNHPYIIGVAAQPYCFVNNVEDIDEITGVGVGANANVNRTTPTNLMPYGLTVLSPLSYADGVPIDITNPTESLNEVYNYGCFKGSSTLTGIPLFGVYSNRDAISPNLGFIAMESSATLKMLWFLPNEHAVYREKNNGTSGRYGYYYLEYYDNGPDDNFVDWVRAQIACFGLFFTEDLATAQRGALNSPLMMLGTLENGIGHGKWTAGTDNENQPQWDWDTTNKSTYRPSGGGDDEGDDNNEYGRTWGFNPVSLADSTIRRYVMSDAELANLGTYLWDIIDTSDPDALIQNQTLTNFLTNNPLDCVVSLKRFPFRDMSQSSLVNLVLGKVTVPNVAGKPFTTDSAIRSCGTKHIYHRFHDWRDFICQYFLYLPFCGTIQLDAETVVGRDVGVYYAIDYTTGTCTAYVTTWDDNKAECYIDSASGNCAIDIPLSGVETATLTGEIYNANENLKALKFNAIVGGTKSAMNFVSKVGSGDKMQSMLSGLDLGADIVNAIHTANQAEWNINNTQIPLKMIGASSGCNSFQGELTPCLLIYYPETIEDFDAANYAHSVGLQCCESGKIGDYSGYTEITNVDLSGFTATATEKNMIQNALSGGVYL